MKPFQGIFIILVSIIFSVFWALDTYSSSSFSDFETNISAESSNVKIKKLQSLFFELKLYSWSIDGEYSKIEKPLIDYQIKSWIIVNRDDWWAWYFWKKTLSELEKDFWDKFSDNINILKVEEPQVEERYFYVTAYYSPLPWQKRYTTWSFAWDKRLNGNWKITASWKWVFPWLLAAPRNYKFGMKIELEWIWIWSVEDRWWAIVNAGERWFEHDRLDVWMWYGDEWLNRALKWGKRKIRWRIVEDEQYTTVWFDESPVEKYNDLRVSEESNEDDIIKLQSLFTEIKLYNKEIDWNYNSIKDNLIDYQVKYNIVKSRTSEEAWYFWVKTLEVLRSQFWSWIFAEVEYSGNYTKLTRREILKLKKIKDKVLSYIDKVSGWNKIKKYKVKIVFKNKLQKIIDKTGSKKKKQQLKFLKLII